MEMFNREVLRIILLAAILISEEEKKTWITKFVIGTKKAE